MNKPTQVNELCHKQICSLKPIFEIENIQFWHFYIVNAVLLRNSMSVLLFYYVAVTFEDLKFCQDCHKVVVVDPTVGAEFMPQNSEGFIV